MTTASALLVLRRETVVDRLLNRLYAAIVEMDLGLSGPSIGRDLLASANRALSFVGGPRLASLEDVGAVRRAVRALEGESGS